MGIVEILSARKKGKSDHLSIFFIIQGKICYILENILYFLLCIYMSFSFLLLQWDHSCFVI